mmetsp:Transcript_9620/g.14850  ORF Transcript_9620/g.14850 Transcript_9620/m.14850 type:complete len:94 (-) Transcript_9620:925-1206(-)
MALSLATVLMGHDSLQEVMPLCEIVDCQVDAGYRGKVTITVQLRSVERASKVELTRMKPFMMGLCKDFLRILTKRMEFCKKQTILSTTSKESL